MNLRMDPLLGTIQRVYMNLALKLVALGMDMDGVPEQSLLELKGRPYYLYGQNLLENALYNIGVMEHAQIDLALYNIGDRAWVFIL